MKEFRSLSVWRQGHELALAVYEATRAFPPEERFGLTSQLRRAIVSIGANLAEGSGRATDADFARFVDYALGSANEADYYLLLARDLGLLTDPHQRTLHTRIETLRRSLRALQARLRGSHP